jgi:DNA-binding LytR/AlgR family response regulator
MERISAVSVDDEPVAHDVLRHHLTSNSITYPIDLEACFQNPIAAIDYIDRHHPDVLFLDVSMPSISGLDLLKTITWTPVTILVSAHNSYAMEAFSLGVRDYLLKPLSAERIARCLENIMPLVTMRFGSTQPRPTGRILFRTGLQERMIELELIEFIEAEGNFSLLHCGDQRCLVSESLKQLESRLQPFGFTRIHRSTLINTERVVSVYPSELIMKSGVVLKIGRAYRTALEHFRLG